MAAYLGNISIENAYLGSSAISACYLGSSYIFPLASNATLKYKAASQVTPNVAYSDSSWTLTLSADTFANSAGTVTFSGTGLTIPTKAYSAASFTEMTIGRGVISIGEYAFSNCDDLASIKIPNTVTSIGTTAFHNSGLTGVTIPNSVTSLGAGVFWESRSLTTAVLPSGLTSIPNQCFMSCTALTSVDIPVGVTTIGQDAFRNTYSLTAVTIPSGVTELGYAAFQNSGIVELTFEGDTPPTPINVPFVGVASAGTIYCPATAIAAYTTWAQTWGLSGWTVFVPSSEPLTIEFTSAGSIGWSSNFRRYFNLQYSLNGGEWASAMYSTTTPLTVQSGDIVQLRASGAPTGDITSSATPTKIIGTCTVRGYYTSLEDPDNYSAVTAVTHTVPALFKGVTGLTDASGLVMPEVTLANQHAAMFSGCTSLTTAPLLPTAILTSGCYNRMFYGCSSLSSITCLATNRDAANCTLGWVDGVAASGTFTKDASYSLWSTGINGIPSGWTVQDA